jgi:hypothetical protein
MNKDIDSINPNEIKGESDAQLQDADLARFKAQQEADTLKAQLLNETDPEKAKELVIISDDAAKKLTDTEKMVLVAEDNRKSVDYRIEEAKRLEINAETVHAKTEIVGQPVENSPNIFAQNKLSMASEKTYRSTPVFPNPPDNEHEDTRNAVIVVSAIINKSEEEKEQGAQELIKSCRQPNSQNLYVGEIKPGDKIYAFTTASSVQERGEKSTTSYYFVTETKLRTMAEHGLIDFQNRSYNSGAISDILGVPPENKVNCIVEVTANNRVAYIELPIGAVAWQKESEFGIVPGENYNQVEVFNRTGDGYQAFPDLARLNLSREFKTTAEDTCKTFDKPQADLNKTLPIARLNTLIGDEKCNVKCDFREESGWADRSRELTQEEINAFKADYEQRRVSGQAEADKIMNDDKSKSSNNKEEKFIGNKNRDER